MTTTVRGARPDDIGRIVELLAAGTLRGGEDLSNPGPYLAALKEIEASPGSEVLVAEVDGAVAGVCQLITFRHLQERGGLCAEIESVHVDENLRSRGIGGALLDAAVERARNLGCYRVQLTSNKTRTDAHRFYQRHGFSPTHEGYKLYL